MRGDESAVHFICDCSTFSYSRLCILGVVKLYREQLAEMNLFFLLKFPKSTGRSEKVLELAYASRRGGSVD